MAFFYRFTGLFDDIKSGVKEVKTIVKEGKNEFNEIMTDGFKEMVVKGNSDYQTSYEKRDKAHSILNKAQQKLQHRAAEVKDFADETEQIVEQFYSYRTETMQQILNTTNSFLQYIYSNNYLSTQSIETANLLRDFSNNPLPILKLTGTIFSGAIPVAIISLIEKRQRVEEADSMLEDAYVYERKVEAQIANLNSIESKLNFIHNVISEERLLLSRLYKKIHMVVHDIDSLKAKTTITAAEQLKINELTKIVELLVQTLNIEFITKNLKISPEYKQNIKNIQEYLK